MPTNHRTYANAIYTDLLNSPTDLVARISDALLASANAAPLPAAVGYVIKGIEAFREATFRKGGKAAEGIFDLCLAQDLDDLRAAPEAAGIAELPIWLGDAPPQWAMQQWDSLKGKLLEAGWDVWVDWYYDRLAGTGRSKAHDFAYVQVPNELWPQGSAAVNDWIRNRLYEAAGLLLPETAPDRPEENIVPAVPEQRPAAIEPIWSNGRLTLPSKPAKLDLTGRKFTAALKSLREELRTFADDIAGEANIDKRFVAHVGSLADKIPQKAPRQTELFRLGHASVVFAAYAKTVDGQWPDFLAARYHAIVLHFERTMLQSPLWREFKNNADQQVLTDKQIDNSYWLGTEVANELRSEEAKDFIDPAIPDALDRLTGPLFSRIPIGNEPRDDVVEAGTTVLAYDVVESVNNTVKRIAEEALKAKALAGAATRNVGSTLGEAGKDYTAGVGKGFKRAAKRQGSIDGEKLFKLLRRIALGAIGSAASLPPLIAMYPQAFAWLQALLKFLH